MGPVFVARLRTTEAPPEQLWTKSQKRYISSLYRDRFIDDSNDRLIYLLKKTDVQDDISMAEADELIRLLKECAYKSEWGDSTV
jgi:hypothetical protein